MKQHVEGVKAEVRDTMERYVKELRDRQTLLNSELDTFQQAELRNLRSVFAQDFQRECARAKSKQTKSLVW